MALNHTFPVATPLQFLRTLQCGQISACPNTATGERLYEFLRERNKEGVVQMLKKENLDKNVVSSMTNQDLEQYIPKVEDGEAAVSLCRKRAVLPLFAPRARVGFKRLRHKAAPFSRQLYGIGNTNAKRTIKRIELGWMNFDEDDERYKQVRTKSGGGTLPLSIDVGNTMNDIKALAESLFFPDGVSKRNQRLADYSTHIESSQGHVDMTDTVAQAYEKIKGKILRLYLCTTKIREGDVTDHRQSPGDLECVEHVDDET